MSGQDVGRWARQCVTVGLIAGVAVGIGWWTSPVAGAATSAGILSGEVATVDAHDQTLTVNTGLMGQEMFTLLDRTRIMNGDQPLALRDLQPGDNVTIHYAETDEGSRVPQMIIVKRTDVRSSPAGPGGE